MGQVLLAGEEAHERAAALGGGVADGAAQRRVAGLEGVEHGALRNRTLDRELHLTLDPGQGLQVRGEHDADHGSVWTSTDSTAGRSRTMGAQRSPASPDAYTWPPVVPK